jgi:hypothetical protein
VLNLVDPVVLDDLVVFRDDEHASTFYMLPDQPVIPLDDEGAPEFLFIKYIRDVGELAEGEEAGGGYVQFRSVLTVSDERRQRVVEALRARLQEEQAAGRKPFGLEITSTEPLLAAPLWTEGTVSLATFAVSDTGLVRRATETAPVDLAGDLGASLRVDLDPDGAELFWSAFTEFGDRQIPILVTYQLKYRARVAASMEIHAKREVIHRTFWDVARPYRLLMLPFVRYGPIPFAGPLTLARMADLRGTMAEPIAACLIRPQIEETLSRTVVNHDIDVRIETDQAGGGEDAAKVQEMLFDLATSVLADRIVPALFGEASSLPGAARDQDDRATLDLVQLSEQDGPDMTFDMTVAHLSTIERPVNPNGPIHVILGSPEAAEACFRELRLSDGFFSLMRVTASTAGVNFARDGIERIHLMLRYEHRDQASPSRPMVQRHTDGQLTSESDAFHWRFDLARSAGGGHLRSYQYRMDVFYTQGPPSSTDWADSESEMLLITPRAMGAIRVELVLTAPKEVVQSARVSLRYRATTGTQYATAVELTPDATSRTWFQYTGELAGPDAELTPPRYDYQVQYRLGDTDVVTPWATTSEQTLEIPTPFRKVLTFTVRPQGSFEGVSGLSGDLTYDDPAHAYRVVRGFLLTSLTDSAEVRIPVFDGAPEVVTWTARLGRADGSSLGLGPGQSGPGTVWVGAEVDFLEVQVLPDLLDFESDVQLAVVQLHYEDTANGVDETDTFTFSKTSRDGKVWKVARKDPDRDAYDAEIRYIAYDRTTSSELHLEQIRDQVLVLDRTTGGP